MQEDFPELVSPHMRLLLERLSAANPADGTEEGALDAMRRQLFFSPEERVVLPCEIPDPLGARLYHVAPRTVHQYKNRVLVLTTARCFAHCRHCFRRSYTARRQGWISGQETDGICGYLSSRPEVKEILLSGGDPLTATDLQLESMVSQLREARPGILVRICTRAPVFAPERLTGGLVSLLRSMRPLWVVPHINHPAEISPRHSPESLDALRRLVDAGIPVQSQTVLLKGVNDSVGVLEELFHRLTCAGVKPGYLFQGDLVPGTSHLRLPVAEGVRLYERLRRELSGLSTPVYAVDLPGGGGKMNLLQLDSSLLDVSVERAGDEYVFTKGDASTWKYPAE